MELLHICELCPTKHVCRCEAAAAACAGGRGQRRSSVGRKRPRAVPGSLGRGLWVAVVGGDKTVLPCCG